MKISMIKVAPSSSINSKKNINFGWKHSTHYELNRQLVEKYNKFLPKPIQFDPEMVIDDCTIPDTYKNRTFKYRNKVYSFKLPGHFADVDNLISGDIPDGYHLARILTLKALDLHKEGNYAKRDKYISFATHFLADPTQPYHSEGFTYMKKTNPIRVAHKNFEAKAVDYQKSVFESASNVDITADYKHFFNNILPNSLREAKNIYAEIKLNNYKNTEDTVIKALTNTYKTLNIYFAMLTEVLKNLT